MLARKNTAAVNQAKFTPIYKMARPLTDEKPQSVATKMPIMAANEDSAPKEKTGSLYDAFGDIMGTYNTALDGSLVIKNMKQGYSVTGPVIVYDKNGDQFGTWLAGTDQLTQHNNAARNDTHKSAIKEKKKSTINIKAENFFELVDDGDHRTVLLFR